MAVQKQVRFIYQAKNSATGLTDIKAQIYLNGTAVAVGAGAISATPTANGSKVTEISSSNVPGLYEVLLAAADLSAWGVSPSQYNVIEALVDSASKPAAAPFREEITVSNADDLESHLVTQDTNIASIKSDTAAIKSDLETGPNNLGNIYNALLAIQNNAGFSVGVPSQLLKPGSGSNLYRVPITIYDENNNLKDPDSNSIVVTLVNQAGTDRSSYLTGASGGSAPMVKDSTGQYHIDITIPSTAVQEELLFNFAYSIATKATARRAVTQIITDVQADGFALQSTLLDVQTRVTDVQSKVNDGTFGLAAANTLQNLIKTQTDKIGDGTIGLAAIKTAITTLQSDVTSNVEGTGFDNTQDSLHQLSLFMRANIYSGGRAF